jgi:hypothetical protein
MSTIGIAVAVALSALLAAGSVCAQQPYREYPSIEHGWSPPFQWNHQEHAEFVVGRLMYPQSRSRYVLGAGYGDWLRGGTAWTVDYPEADRTLARLLSRLTRMDVRAVEQPVNPDDGDDIDYWPFMIVGLAQAWQLTDEEAANIREYLLRGGFMFCDSFFGARNWAVFEESLKRVFPDRPIIDLTDDHPIFHTVFDLPGMTKVMIPHVSMAFNGGRGGLGYGEVPRWRGVVDDHGRLMVLIAFNNDTADAWQWADDPRYPGELANLALRLGVNVAMYAMTH